MSEVLIVSDQVATEAAIRAVNEVMSFLKASKAFKVP